MASNHPFPHQYYGNSPADVRLSIYEYYDMIDTLYDDRLSAKTLMKFKELFRANSIQLLVLPVVSFPFAWIANKWFAGGVNRGMASARFNLLGMALFYPLTLYYAATQIRIPRKLYTEVLADNGDDGQYIRHMLRMRKPGLWSHITPQLQNLGYQFKQSATSSVAVQFPQAFQSVESL